MLRAPLISICVGLLLIISSKAKPNGKDKKTKQVVPDIDCDMRAGKINFPEFLVRCPSNCRETKEKVYGTGVFASISSICNAAIHNGVITNSGGKVIVKKMAGQAQYKGSFANGIRSLSLPNWRESFTVSVGKPKKGVIYPATLELISSKSTVQTSQKEARVLALPTALPMTAAPEPRTTTLKPTTTTTTTTTTSPPTTTRTTTTTTTAKLRAAVHKVRDAGRGIGHPYLASVAAAASARQTQNGQAKGLSQAFRGGSGFAGRYSPRINPVARRPETGTNIRRQPPAPPTSALVRRKYPHPANAQPDWFSGQRRPTDISNSEPDTGYTWSNVDPVDSPAPDPRPDISEYERWYYNFGQHSSRTAETDNGPRRLPETLHTKVESGEVWKPEGNPSDSDFPTSQDSNSQGDPNCKVDIAFLMDGSWSIGKRRFKIQKDFLAEVSQVLNVGINGPMMGIVQYGDEAATEFGLRQFSSSKELKPAIDKILQKGGLSNVGNALSYINKHFFSDANGNRGGAPNVAVVLVDGWPTDKVDEASRLARESGINIFFVTIEGPDESEKHNVVESNFVDKAVCRTNGYYSLPVNSWFALRKAAQPLVKRMCDTDRLMCSKTCLNANDIAFVIDGSSSVGTSNFRTVLQFVANVTREFEISDTDTRIGAVQYTYEQRLEFAFGQHNTKAEVLNAIRQISYWSGGTSTGAAITFAADKLFSKSKPNKRKIMIVITDGRSYDDVRAPALAVQRSGVIAYSIGIAWAAQDELEYIATDPDKDHSFFVDEFDNLYKYVPKIIHNICNEFNSQPRN
ncbi:vitrin isoform X1 [Silurus meridionalis]|uniref:vitrin isoform X1 n=1 Tax=Silurus meridionalis TaxID=175797 RepID=UPI001EEC648E|nr:vitrin isoform X1 [Silurus meridionalis]